MRIAVFLTSYQIGGVEKVFITLLNAWAKSGHNVYAYVLRNEGEFKEDVDEKVSIVNLNCVSLWKSFFKISRLLRQHRIEYFMVAKDIENIFFTVMKMFTRCRCKVIISQHNYFYISGTGKVSLIVKALPKVMKLIYRHSSHIICVAKGIEQYVKTLNVREGQTTVIYNPMDISMVEEASRKSINMTGKFISYCGRFSSIKNIELLINGFEIFHQDHPNYQLLLIGAGSEEETLKQLVREKKITDSVHFLGSISNPHCYVSRSQVLVLPSYSEAFPMVICEAFAVGTTVVSTPSGGPNELLEDGRGYLLKGFRDAKEMAEVIAYACEHPIDSQLLKDYVSRFETSKVAQQYIDTFASL